MAYDLEEQEQLATIKAFWRQYGSLLLTAVTVVLLAIAGWRGRGNARPGVDLPAQRAVGLFGAQPAGPAQLPRHCRQQQLQRMARTGRRGAPPSSV
jgi:hypothetical protein